MALNFNGSTQLLTGAFAPASNVPLTVACWCRVKTAAGGSVAMAIDNGGVGAAYRGLTLNVPNDAPSGQRAIALTFIDSGTISLAETTPNPWTLNAWRLFVAVWASATDRRVFQDGQNRGINATSRVVTTLTQMSIGARRPGAATNFIGADIAWPTIWDVALTESEIALLRVRHPMSIRRQSVMDCWSLADLSAAGLTSLVTGRVLIAVNSPVVVPDPPGFVWRYPGGLDLDESGDIGAGQIYRQAQLAGLGTGGRRITDRLS